MSNILQITRENTFFSSFPCQSAPECLDGHTHFRSSELSFSHSSTSSSIQLDSKMCSAHCKSNSLWSNFSNIDPSVNSQNTRLIPLKLGSTYNLPSPKSPTYDGALPSPMTRRKSYTNDLENLPSSPSEWKVVMAEVKATYLRRQYKQCARRCRTLLARTKNLPSIEPVYRIYIASYLAYSLEIVASASPKKSTAKLQYYQEALDCYQSATADVEAALCAVDAEINGVSTFDTTSNLSSARSSVDSVFSQYSTSSSVASTIPEEGCQRDEGTDIECPKIRRKKNVSFLFPTPRQTRYSLDHDDPYHPIPPNSLIDSFPIPPSSVSPTLGSDLTPELSTLSLRTDRSLENSPSRENFLDPAKRNHLRQYQCLLYGFRSQFDYHITSTQNRIHNLRHPLTTARDLSNFYSKESEERNMPTMGQSKKRFDSSRYQELCERALKETSLPK